MSVSRAWLHRASRTCRPLYDVGWLFVIRDNGRLHRLMSDDVGWCWMMCIILAYAIRCEHVTQLLQPPNALPSFLALHVYKSIFRSVLFQPLPPLSPSGYLLDFSLYLSCAVHVHCALYNCLISHLSLYLSLSAPVCVCLYLTRPLSLSLSVSVYLYLRLSHSFTHSLCLSRSLCLCLSLSLLRIPYFGHSHSFWFCLSLLLPVRLFIIADHFSWTLLIISLYKCRDKKRWIICAQRSREQPTCRGCCNLSRFPINICRQATEWLQRWIICSSYPSPSLYLSHLSLLISLVHVQFRWFSFLPSAIFRESSLLSLPLLLDHSPSLSVSLSLFVSDCLVFFIMLDIFLLVLFRSPLYLTVLIFCLSASLCICISRYRSLSICRSLSLSCLWFCAFMFFSHLSLSQKKSLPTCVFATNISFLLNTILSISACYFCYFMSDHLCVGLPTCLANSVCRHVSDNF